jgi:hypothetical protein
MGIREVEVDPDGKGYRVVIDAANNPIHRPTPPAPPVITGRAATNNNEGNT